MFVKKQQKPINPPLAINQMLQCFVMALLKWIKYKNRLTFTYYSIKFWDFKSLESVPKTSQVLKTKKEFFFKDSQIPFFMITNPDFLLIFPVISGIVQCWKYRSPTTFFPKSRNTVLKIFICRSPANTTPPFLGWFGGSTTLLLKTNNCCVVSWNMYSMKKK